MMSFAIDGLKENMDTQWVCPVQKNVLHCPFVTKCTFGHAKTVYVIYSDIVSNAWQISPVEDSSKVLYKTIFG